MPWCTTQGQLSNSQLIALSDVAGSLTELVRLCLAAAVDEGARSVIEGAVGSEAAAGVIEFWTDEWTAE